MSEPSIPDISEFQRRASARLRTVPPDLHGGPLNGSEADRSDDDLNPASAPIVPGGDAAGLTPAAVLVPVVERADGLSIILTERAAALRTHAGQIAFPGGRIDPTDRDAADAALREAEEEIGLSRSLVTVLGYLDRYRTGTGFVVAPVVAAVGADFMPVRRATEVADIFEVPLGFLMDPTNHQTHERPWRGVRRRYYAMPFEDRYIWGATAGMLKNLYDRIYR